MKANSNLYSHIAFKKLIAHHIHQGQVHNTQAKQNKKKENKRNKYNSPSNIVLKVI